MNRNIVARELDKVGVTLIGWKPVLRCKSCGERWEPFLGAEDASAPTVRFDYWMCPKRCNANAKVSDALRIISPRYVEMKDVSGVLFGKEDREEFERYVRSMEATQIPDSSLQ